MAQATSLPIVTNYQIKAYVGANTVYARNVVYDRKNKDGTIDRIERAWMAYPPGDGWHPLCNTVVLESTEGSLNGAAPYGLIAYVQYYEKGGKGTFPNADNRYFGGSYTGRIVKIEHLPKTMDQQVKELSTQVQELTQKITTLALQNAALSQTNQQKDDELRNVSQQLARFNNLLEQLTKK